MHQYAEPTQPITRRRRSVTSAFEWIECTAKRRRRQRRKRKADKVLSATERCSHHYLYPYAQTYSPHTRTHTLKYCAPVLFSKLLSRVYINAGDRPTQESSAVSPLVDVNRTPFPQGKRDYFAFFVCIFMHSLNSRLPIGCHTVNNEECGSL